MERVEKCDNCRRARELKNGHMICDVGNKNKVLHDGWQYTDAYYWCNGRYQQQIGKEGRLFIDEIVK